MVDYLVNAKPFPIWIWDRSGRHVHLKPNSPIQLNEVIISDETSPLFNKKIIADLIANGTLVTLQK